MKTVLQTVLRNASARAAQNSSKSFRKFVRTNLVARMLRGLFGGMMFARPPEAAVQPDTKGVSDRKAKLLTGPGKAGSR
jgi:hypothetical protein